MKETLVCSVCEKKWKREITRGRKPTVCPKCITAAEKAAEKAKKAASADGASKTRQKKIPVVKIVDSPKAEEPSAEKEIKISKALVYRDYYPHPSDYDEMIASTRHGSEWCCPSCKKTYISQVPLVVAPTHRCPPLSTKIKSFERVNK